MAPAHQPLLPLLALLGASLLFVPCDGQATDLLPVAQLGDVARAPMPATVHDFAELVQRQGAAVVSISSRKIIIGRLRWPGRPGGPTPDDAPLQMFYHESPGSGFIIDPDGYILTSAQAVDDSEAVSVALTDQREFTAKLVGIDPRSDVALLKISAGNLPVVAIGDPSKLQVGEWIVAIGTPFGFANSVTQGIVSAKGRALPGDKIIPFIQTDAAINPGSAGGPLFNLDGEVVGINSRISRQRGGATGVSFALPIDVALRIKDQLLQYGTVRRGRLGVSIQDVSAELAESFALESASGALIAYLEKGGGAERAGFLVGDIVLQMNGKTVANSVELARAISDTAPGTRVRLRVWRNAAIIEIAATLGSADVEPAREETKP